ncbi:MAG: hypothetical protein ACRERU_23135 [Methylococcales bacterium]
MLETGDIHRFTGPGNYASYCRCVDSDRRSNGKKKGSGNAKAGNPYRSGRPFPKRLVLRSVSSHSHNDFMNTRRPKPMESSQSGQSPENWPGPPADDVETPTALGGAIDVSRLSLDDGGEPAGRVW